MGRKRPVSWISAVVCMLLLGSCQDHILPEERAITSVKLICIQTCVDDKPFQEREYTESDDIHAFKRAISNARAMEGMLNYGAEFELVILYNGQPTEQYHLSLNREKGREGLLVRLPNTHQGYVIPISDADRLRDLIWD